MLQEGDVLILEAVMATLAGARRLPRRNNGRSGEHGGSTREETTLHWRHDVDVVRRCLGGENYEQIGRLHVRYWQSCCFDGIGRASSTHTSSTQAWQWQFDGVIRALAEHGIGSLME